MKQLSLLNSRLDKRYDVLKELGRGSYAEIFIARDTLASPHSPHSTVVIKALNVFLQDDLDPDLEKTLVENFQNEAIALDRVRHPNIISRLGHGSAKDLKGMMFHYLVLEYLEGGDLQKAIRERSLTIKSALNYIEQVCAGLRHAHRQGIIHRDIKPQNLLLSKDRDIVKIADFGVARNFQTDAPITRVGTNIYAPPEHSPIAIGASGIPNQLRLTPAADVYSLAKTCYTLLTGEAPRFYANQPITELPFACRTEEWYSELKRVLNKATLNDPGLRHQNVDEFWYDLEEVRRHAIDSETVTHVRPKLHELPQPHISKGYSPLAPNEPSFNTSRDLKGKLPSVSLDEELAARDRKRMNFGVPLAQPIEPAELQSQRVASDNIDVRLDEESLLGGVLGARVSRPGGIPKRAVVYLLIFLTFAGGLYGTSVYLRGVGGLPELRNPFARDRMGTANTDINLRPEPSANNRPIGLVTRHSRVKIIREENNWYLVDIVQQGRQRPDNSTVSRGWLSGRYVDLDE